MTLGWCCRECDVAEIRGKKPPHGQDIPYAPLNIEPRKPVVGETAPPRAEAGAGKERKG